MDECKGLQGADALEAYRAVQKRLKEENRVVTEPIARLGSEMLKSTKQKGYGLKYTPTRLRNGINKYFEWCEKTDSLPSMKGMAIYLKIGITTFYEYMRRPEFMEIMEQARLSVSEWCERDVYGTKGMAAGKIAYMKNIMGWKERIETETTSVTIDMTPEMARAKIESLAPKLLEVLKNSTVLNQLVKQEPIEITEG